MKKRLLKYFSIFAILTFAFYHLTIQFLPNGIYGILKYRALNDRGYATNELVYNPLPTSESRAVVMPNPDFLYISCFYDLSEGPLHLTGIMPDFSYWSVAFYQPNTVNWYIKNDLEYGTNDLSLILSKDENLNNPTNTEIAVAPEDEGFLLIRILVSNDSAHILKKYVHWQKSVRLKKF